MTIRAEWTADMRWHRLLVVSGLCLTLAACSNDTLSSVSNKVEHPLPTKVVNRMKAYDMTQASPIMMRIFKEESVLEIWKAKTNGRYEKIAEYEICKWSGQLGPKQAEGDRQAPEGFYTVNRHQMNPNSSYYLSFNLGYPNRFDRAHGRTGTNLMVHGACSSAGCYSMTDEQVLEIYAFAREAFRGGQESFQVQALPFRMTAENMARHRENPNYAFWEMLKVGYDHFELTKTPPKVDVCNREYIFNQVPTDTNAVFDASAACPATSTPESLQVAYQTYVQDYEAAFQEALQKQTGQRPGRSGSLSRLLPANQSSPASVAATSAAITAPAPVASTTPAAAAVAPAAAATQHAVSAEAAQPSAIPVVQPVSATVSEGATPGTVPATTTALPVPAANPLAATTTSLYAAPAQAPAQEVAERPRWSLWGRN